MARGQATRFLTISRWRSYHGTTMGALAVSGRPGMRSMYMPMIQDMPHIPPPYCYRCPYTLSYPSCDLACATELENQINVLGAEDVAAFLAEPLSGILPGGCGPAARILASHS